MKINHLIWRLVPSALEEIEDPEDKGLSEKILKEISIKVVRRSALWSDHQPMTTFDNVLGLTMRLGSSSDGVENLYVPLFLNSNLLPNQDAGYILMEFLSGSAPDRY